MECRCAVVLVRGRWQRTTNLVPAYPPSFSLPRLGTSVAVSSLPESQSAQRRAAPPSSPPACHLLSPPTFCKLSPVLSSSTIIARSTVHHAICAWPLLNNHLNTLSERPLGASAFFLP